mgnify:CR=1 FL=1
MISNFEQRLAHESLAALLDRCQPMEVQYLLDRLRAGEINGSSSAHVVMRDCQGGIAVTSGNTATWKAENCSGPSPLGNLSLKASLGTV